MFHPNLQRIFNQFSVTNPSDKALLLAAFEAGIKASQGESNQQPVLEVKPTVINFDGFLVSGDDFLTQAEVHFLKNRLGFAAQQLQRDRRSMKVAEKVLYTLCDKEIPSTSGTFARLNGVRDMIRESKAEEAKVNNIIRKLKAV